MLYGLGHNSEMLKSLCSRAIFHKIAPSCIVYCAIQCGRRVVWEKNEWEKDIDKSVHLVHNTTMK